MPSPLAAAAVALSLAAALPGAASAGYAFDAIDGGTTICPASAGGPCWW